MLVGQALGGAIAARFASGHSDRLSGLVLVNTFGLGPFRPAPAAALATVRFVARPTMRTHTSLLRQLTHDLNGLRQHRDELSEPLEEYCVVRTRAPGAKAAQRVLIGQVGVRAIPSADLARIAVPTTLIWGRHDRMMRLQTAETASARYGWALRVIENAGSAPYIEQPVAFLEALRPVLEAS